MTIHSPVMITIGNLSLHPHVFFDTLSYTVGITLYFWLSQKTNLSFPKKWLLIAGALVGASVGGIVLNLFANPMNWFENGNLPSPGLLQGKTIVGGLWGGIIGVELAKKAMGYQDSTGDTLLFPLIVGMIFGRMGCFLTGLGDHTCGTPTHLPWAVDFGDGIPRHPTQIYEILFLAGMIPALVWRRHRPHEQGDLFKLFLVGYLLFRFLVDFIKPYPRFFMGLNAIQVAALAGILYYATSFRRRMFNEGKTHA